LDKAIFHSINALLWLWKKINLNMNLIHSL